jgi:hypothetical protein
MPVVARMGVTGAFAIVIAPYTLGELADRLSLFAALGTIPVLVLIAAAALRLDDRRELHRAPAVCSHSACARLSSPASTASQPAAHAETSRCGRPTVTTNCVA